LANDCQVAVVIKRQRHDTRIGFVRAHAATSPTDTLKSCRVIDWVGHREFDFTCRKVAEGRPLAGIRGLSCRPPEGRIRHNAEREPVADMDVLPWVANIYRRDLDIRKYAIGWLPGPDYRLFWPTNLTARVTRLTGRLLAGTLRNRWPVARSSAVRGTAFTAWTWPKSRRS
jgi:hypothetical protein